MTGNFTVVNPVSLGLPAASMTASWVDFDNDGTIDLYLAPQGLYRQIPGLGKFELSTLLSDISFPETSWQACSAWFDSNMDGRRDFLVTYLDKGRTWLAVFYANQVMNDNHWLEVDVINVEGISASLGAVVTVSTPDGAQRQEVGWSEDSHFSQGHYRLYFGLGQYRRIDRLRVRWQDGTYQEWRNVRGDRLITLNYGKPEQKP